MTLTIAFVGVAHWHAPIYRDCLQPLDARIVGSSDLDAVAGKAAAGRLGLPFEADAAAMLARTRPDFVFVTPRHGFGEPVEEYASAMLALAGGAVVQVEAGYSWTPSSGGDFEWRIAATGAHLQ
jgi:hypothetical protein